MAEQLSADIQRALDILRDSEVQQAFGAHDAWQVIDNVNTTYLGGARNVARIRTKAQAGRCIFGWLAKLDHLQRGTMPNSSTRWSLDCRERHIG